MKRTQGGRACCRLGVGSDPRSGHPRKRAEAEAIGIVTALHDVNGGESGRRGRARAAGRHRSRGARLARGREHPRLRGDQDPHRRVARRIDDSCIAPQCSARRREDVLLQFHAGRDWTRTDLLWTLADGGMALGSTPSISRLSTFSCCAGGAEADHSPERVAAARERFAAMTATRWRGWNGRYRLAAGARFLLRPRGSPRGRALQWHRGRSAPHLFAFLREVVAVADAVGARLGIHPDDPSFPLFGLPRVVSTAETFARCSVRSFDCLRDDVLRRLVRLARGERRLAMAREFGPACVRASARCAPRGGRLVLRGRASRRRNRHGAHRRDADRRRGAAPAEGRADAEIPMRPDHGHLLADDGNKPVNPGYSFIGRLKGLAELRGVMQTVEAFRSGRAE